MMSWKRIFLTCLLATLVLQLTQETRAQTAAQRRVELLSIIDQEYKEVLRLNRNTRSTNPEFLLRMSELLLEKARLIRDEESKKILEIPPAQRPPNKLERSLRREQ